MYLVPSTMPHPTQLSSQPTCRKSHCQRQISFPVHKCHLLNQSLSPSLPLLSPSLSLPSLPLLFSFLPFLCILGNK